MLKQHGRGGRETSATEPEKEKGKEKSKGPSLGMLEGKKKKKPKQQDEEEESGGCAGGRREEMKDGGMQCSSPWERGAEEGCGGKGWRPNSSQGESEWVCAWCSL